MELLSIIACGICVMILAVASTVIFPNLDAVELLAGVALAGVLGVLLTRTATRIWPPFGSATSWGTRITATVCLYILIKSTWGDLLAAKMYGAAGMGILSFAIIGALPIGGLLDLLIAIGGAAVDAESERRDNARTPTHDRGTTARVINTPPTRETGEFSYDPARFGRK